MAYFATSWHASYGSAPIFPEGCRITLRVPRHRHVDRAGTGVVRLAGSAGPSRPLSRRPFRVRRHGRGRGARLVADRPDRDKQQGEVERGFPHRSVSTVPPDRLWLKSREGVPSRASDRPHPPQCLLEREPQPLARPELRRSSAPRTRGLEGLAPKVSSNFGGLSGKQTESPPSSPARPCFSTAQRVELVTRVPPPASPNPSPPHSCCRPPASCRHSRGKAASTFGWQLHPARCTGSGGSSTRFRRHRGA